MKENSLTIPIEGSDFNDANLIGANLTGADLSSAVVEKGQFGGNL